MAPIVWTSVSGVLPDLEVTTNRVVARSRLESARSSVHLADIFRLADRAGLLRDPDAAVARMRTVLAARGIDA